MLIEEYFGDWLEVMDTSKLMSVVHKVNNLYATTEVNPEYSDIFKAFRLCSRKDCRIVFIGQDPYPQKFTATGLLFANKKGTINLSPSLEVIKEASINYTVPHNPIVFDITMESWAKQGILMLNSSLTCEIGKPGSHTMLWRPFISDFLSRLSVVETGLVYVLFGTQAQTFEPYINSSLNDILRSKHPAYYARIGKRMPSDIFIKINSIMKSRYNTCIEWFKEQDNEI